MPRSGRRGQLRGCVALTALTLVAVSGCGSRVSRDAVLAAEAGLGSRVPAALAQGTAVATDNPASTAEAAPAPPAAGTAVAPAATQAIKVPSGASTTTATAKPASAPVKVAATASDKGASVPAATAGGEGLPVFCAKPGPPISIGQVGSWSGLVGASIGQARPALALWAKYMNDHGGVACHPVQLRSLDDQSNPSSAAAAARTLIQDDKAIALVAVFSPISVSGIQSVTKSTGVPAVGGDGAAHAWTSDPYLYDVGAAIESQFYLAAKHEAQEGRKKVAIFYCVEASACSNAGESLSGNSPLSATAAGQQVVYKATMSLTQTDFTAQCEGAKNAGADSLFLGMEGSSITRFLQSCDSIDYHPSIYTVGIAAVFDVNNPAIKKYKISIGAPVFPYMEQDNSVEAAFAGAFDKYAPGFKYNAVAAQAWAEGMLFQRALELLGPAAQSEQITTALLLKGLSMIKNDGLGGLIPPQTYTPGAGGNGPNPCGAVLVYTAGVWASADKSVFSCGPKIGGKQSAAVVGAVSDQATAPQTVSPAVLAERRRTATEY
jgi:branched-chain amino acid transport system substrate-binding protein